MARGTKCQVCGTITPHSAGMPGPLKNVHYSVGYKLWLCYKCFIWNTKDEARRRTKYRPQSVLVDKPWVNIRPAPED